MTDLSKFKDAFPASFLAAMEHVLAWEGGWSDHKDDPGGKTYRGVTLALFKRWRNNPAVGAAELRALSEREALEIYHTLFWRAVQAEYMPAGLDVLVMDAAVNSGPKNATRALQNTINTFAPIKLKTDGVMGPQTLGAIAGLDVVRMIGEYGARRMVFYGVLKTFRSFGLGWSRRLMAGIALAQSIHSGAPKHNRGI